MESSRGKLCKLLTEKEVTQALNFVGNFAKKTEKYLSVRKGKLLSIKRYKNLEDKARMLWMCDCGEYIDTTLHGEHKNTTCGCDIRRIDQKNREYFSHKITEYYNGAEHCTYCSSYRDELVNSLCNHRVCKICDYLISNRLQVGDTFESLMENWNPIDNEHTDARRLPYFSGNVNKGFIISGYTLVDVGWYDYCSKLLWVEGADYIICSLSKGNRIRLDRNIKGCKGGRIRIFLHRFILGLGNQVKDIKGDHISGDKLDNRLCNLRMASVIQNQLNRRSLKNNTSGFRGVSIPKGRELRYKVGIKREKVLIYLGIFSDIIEAARCYDNFLRSNYPSPFNRYNFPLYGEIGVKD